MTETNLSAAYVVRSEQGGVVRLTLNRASQFNSLSQAMMTALQAELKEIAQRKDLRVVVLAAEGKAFCAGHDLKEMQQQPEEAFYQALFKQCANLMLQLQHLPQPVIARVQGVATAAGCQLVAMADLAVAVDTARFAVSGINLGLFCSTPAVALSRNLGRKQALEMLLTGDFIDANTALQRGLVNRVVVAEQLDAEINQLCASIIAKPEVAVSMGKQLFYQQLEMGVAAAYQLAGATMTCNLLHHDAQEGIAAFTEKRKPNW